MKTGVEIIAEERKHIRIAKKARYSKIILKIEDAERMERIGCPLLRQDALAEAGAMIAAEIDRLNNVKQG